MAFSWLQLLLYIGSCLLCPDTFGGGKTLWIPCSNALEKISNYDGSLFCAMCIKLSQNTSSMVQNIFSSNTVKKLLHSFVSLMLKFSRPSSSDIVLPSNGCSGSVPTRLWEYDYATPCAVFLTPHGRSKETMPIPFSERTVLPTRLVLPYYLARHRRTFILLQLHTPLSKTHL